MNRFTENMPDDERRYARLAAARVGAKLIEQPWSGGVFDARLFAGPKVPKPTVSGLFSMLEIDWINALAVSVKAEAVWTGQGGDHLFWQIHNSLGAADYVTRRGIDLGLPRAVRDAASLSRQPYLSVLRESLKLGRSRTPWTPDHVRNRQIHFINSDALPEGATEYVTHPWAADAADLPKGKQLQIQFLAEVLNRHRPIPRLEYAHEHHPLMCQPLIELCLQIPTYLLLQGGRQRALAREAFRDRVPLEIIQREDKGDTSALSRETIRRSEAFLREILLDGILVRERIVCPGVLEPYLLHGQSYRPDQSWPLLACITAEFWARTWADAALRAAA